MDKDFTIWVYVSKKGLGIVLSFFLKERIGHWVDFTSDLSFSKVLWGFVVLPSSRGKMCTCYEKMPCIVFNALQPPPNTNKIRFHNYMPWTM
jgi:hypothetical protein